MPPPLLSEPIGASWRFREDLCPKKRPQRGGAEAVGAVGFVICNMRVPNDRGTARLINHQIRRLFRASPVIRSILALPDRGAPQLTASRNAIPGRGFSSQQTTPSCGAAQKGGAAGGGRDQRMIAAAK
jgi:hypothetical protein